MMEVKLDLISDIDLSQLIEKVMERGVTNLVQTYCKINNEYIKSNIKN